MQRKRPRFNTSVFRFLLVSPNFTVRGLASIRNVLHDCPICLNLVDVSSRNPNLLGRVDRSRHDRRGHNRSSDNRACHNHRRRCDGACKHSTNDATHESGPEVAATTSPSAVVVMVSTMMHDWSRSISTVESTVESTRSTKAPMRAAKAGSCESSNSAHCDCHQYCQFLGHFICLLFCSRVFTFSIPCLYYSIIWLQLSIPLWLFVEEPLGLKPDLMYGVNLL